MCCRTAGCSCRWATGCSVARPSRSSRDDRPPLRGRRTDRRLAGPARVDLRRRTVDGTSAALRLGRHRRDRRAGMDAGAASARPGAGVTDPGYFIMARGWMEHGTLKSDEPFSRREAWVWMVEQAFWAPGRVSINGRTVPIERGQFSHSYRFMAIAWKWEIGRVQRFLARLKTDTMIGVSADTGQLVITICNYDKYQMKPRIGLVEIDKAPIQERYATDTKKNESNKRNKEDIGA